MGTRTIDHDTEKGKQMTLPQDAYRHPDPIKHKYISFAKSGMRIFAGIFLCFGQFYAAGTFFILAEVLGIAEEMV